MAAKKKTAETGSPNRADAGKRGAGKSAAGKSVRVKLVRSTIGFNKTQATTVQGMGLRRINHSVELPDTPATRGMIHKVRHLVEVTE